MPPKIYKHRNQRYSIKGEKLLRTGKHGSSCNQEQPKRKEEDNSRNRMAAVDAAQRERRQAWDTRRPRAAQKGNHEQRQAWETRRQRQPRAAQKGNHEGREAWETRRQRQPRAAQKGNHEGWETTQKGNHEGKQVWETRWQRCSDQAAISEISSPVIEK